jgi:hypothetical protein
MMRLRKIEPPQIAEAVPMVAARSNAGRGEIGDVDARVGRDSFVEGRMRSGLLLRTETATAGWPDIAGFRHTARLSKDAVWRLTGDKSMRSTGKP